MVVLRPTMSRRVVLGATASAALVTACSPPPSPSGTDESSGVGTGADVTVTAWLQQKPDKMSPLLGTTYGNAAVLDVTQLPLANATADGEMVPAAAASWESSPDATTITLKLADLTWSDGEPYTADDVVFSLNLYASPDTKTPLASALSGIKGAENLGGDNKEMAGVVATDDKTVEITLSEPDSSLMYQLIRSMYVLPKHALETEDWSKLADSERWSQPGGVPGLGPFVMSANKAGQRIEFTPNEHSPNQAAFDTLVQVQVSQDVATQQLSSGEIDLTLVAPTDVDTVKGLDSVTTGEVLSSGFDRYGVNFEQPYLKDPRVRQAMLCAIDRPGIISAIYDSQAEVVNSSFVSPAIDTSQFDTYDYDPERAKRLLQEAGWDSSQKVEITQASGNPQREAVNQVVLKNFQDVGINGSIKPVDQAQINDILAKGDFDLLLYGGGNYTYDASANVPMTSCEFRLPKGANINRFCNKDIDAHFEVALSTGDPEARLEEFQEAARLENEAVPLLWIARPLRTYAWSSKIAGGLDMGEGMPDTLRSVSQWQLA